MEARWGSVFAKYSTQKFNPIPFNIPESGDKNLYKLSRTPPVTLLESRLHKGDPRRANGCPMSFCDIFSAMEQYLTTTRCDRNVFAHYYGFLCFRHLLHLFCYVILQRTRTPVTYFDNLHPDAEWGNLSNLMIIEALNEAAKIVEDLALVNEFHGVFTSREFLGSMSDRTPGTLAEFIITLLWYDRDSLLTLCVRGLLPGFSLLLLVLLKLLAIYPDKESFHRCTYLGEILILRSYPVGSHCDRRILQGVYRLGCKEMYETSRPDADHLFVGPDDAKTFYQAYSGLLFVWRQNGFNTKSVSINLMNDLAGAVAFSTSKLRPVVADELIDVTTTCFNFLWLLLEHRDRIAAVEHSLFVQHSSNLLHILRTTNRCVSSKDQRLKIAQMLADTEIISLAGRLVLLVLDE
ncbi:hypothetical protein FRC12_017346, partial [Ceratobasidium sp. 428]